MFQALTLVLGLVIITLGAESLIRGAAALAVRLGLSPLFIGIAIVGAGTSSPELGASLSAALSGSGDVAVGNVVGSNIFNIGVILGVASVARPIRIALSTVRRDLLLVVGVAMLPLAAPGLGGTLPRWLGAAMFAAFLVYIVHAYRAARALPAPDAALASAEFSRTLEAPRAPRPPVWRSALLVAIGLALLVFGSNMFVRAAIDAAREWGVSELVIGLTIVAAGTSLPELVTSLVAAIRGSQDIAVGNILGSNIFNILAILGVTTLVRPQTVTAQTLLLDTPVMLALSIALAPLLRTGGRLSRAEGVGLLLAYAAYIVVLILLAPGWFGA